MVIRNEIKGYLAVFFAIFIWSWGEVLIKLIQNEVGAFSYSFLRFFIGAIFLFVILLVKRDFSGIGSMVKKSPALFLMASVLGLGISHILFYIGISNTFANVGALIFTTYPIWTVLYSIFVLNERTNLKLKFVGMAIGIFGVAILMLSFHYNELLSLEQLFGKYSHLFGNMIALIAAMVWSLYSVFGKKIQNNFEDLKDHDLKFTAISFIVAALPLFIILLFTPEFIAIFQYDLNTLLVIMILGVFSSGLAYYLFFFGIKYIEVSKGISLAFLKPILAAIFAFFILGEEITIILLVSLGLVLISIISINRPSKNGEKNKD